MQTATRAAAKVGGDLIRKMHPFEEPHTVAVPATGKHRVSCKLKREICNLLTTNILMFLLLFLTIHYLLFSVFQLFTIFYLLTSV
jgi:hypothetical protein